MERCSFPAAAAEPPGGRRAAGAGGRRALAGPAAGVSKPAIPRRPQRGVGAAADAPAGLPTAGSVHGVRRRRRGGRSPGDPAVAGPPVRLPGAQPRPVLAGRLRGPSAGRPGRRGLGVPAHRAPGLPDRDELAAGHDQRPVRRGRRLRAPGRRLDPGRGRPAAAGARRRTGGPGRPAGAGTRGEGQTGGHPGTPADRPRAARRGRPQPERHRGPGRRGPAGAGRRPRPDRGPGGGRRDRGHRQPGHGRDAPRPGHPARHRTLRGRPGPAARPGPASRPPGPAAVGGAVGGPDRDGRAATGGHQHRPVAVPDRAGGVDQRPQARPRDPRRGRGRLRRARHHGGGHRRRPGATALGGTLARRRHDRDARTRGPVRRRAPGGPPGPGGYAVRVCLPIPAEEDPS
jgi:hypothetical protein